MRDQRKPAWTVGSSRPLLLALLVVILLSPDNAYAGKGTFRKTGEATGVFDFCVSVRFDASESQINRIRTVLQRASDLLAEATNGQHRFGNVQIVTNGGGDEAEILIHPNPGRAYTHQPGYGFPRYMINLYYPTDFETPFGLEAEALTVVHEFSHSAYTLSDEYGKKKNPQTGAIEELGCAPWQPSPIKDPPDLNYCLMDSIYRGGWQHGRTTITVREFCVASNHDPDRDTEQSRYHNNESCWQTMAGLHLTNNGIRRTWNLIPPTGLPATVPIPSVPVNFGMSCEPPRIVLLLDNSLSMETNDRLVYAKRAAEQFINFTAFGGHLSVVSFAGSATVEFPLTQINNAADKNAAVSSANQIGLESATNIGGGLSAALEQLKSQGDCGSCPKTILLLTDGDHNTGLPPEAVLPDLLQSHATLISVVLGSDVSLTSEATLKNMSNQTGGQYYRVAAGFGQTAMQTVADTGSTAANAVETVELGPPGLVGLYVRLAKDLKGEGLLKQQRDVITSGAVREIPVKIESGVANTTFAVTNADEAGGVQLSLRTPFGTILTESGNASVTRVAGPNSQAIQVDTPVTGTWKIVLTSSMVATGKVETSAFSEHDGVHLNVRLANEAVVSTEFMEVKATPIFRGEGVVGATVAGNVKRPDGTQVPITLFDNGLAANGDESANDAVYSARFNTYSVDGTYTFDLNVENVTGTSREGETFSPDEQSSVRPIQPFTRAGSATAILSGLTQGDMVWVDDAVPQGGVTDGDWYWVNTNPGPIKGGAVHQSKLTTRGTNVVSQHFFTKATAKLPINAGDRLFTYVFLDPNFAPDEIMLQWHAADGWEHRAYWGANYIQLGVDETNSRRFMGSLPTPGQWVRLEVPAGAIGLEGKTLDGMAFTTNGSRATWDASGKTNGPAQPPPSGFVWFDDTVPAGAILEVEHDVWEWANTFPPPWSGATCHRSVLAGGTGEGKLRTHGFSKAQTPMKVEPGDVLYTYVYLDPDYKPDEIMLQWNADDGWEHRAFWGNNFVDRGVHGTESRRFMGGLPPAGEWVRLEVPASYVGLEGKPVHGMHFGYYRQNDRARANWDVAGKTARPRTAPLPLQSLVPLYRFRADSYGYSYSTSDIGRADQVIQGVRAYVHPSRAAGTVPFYRFRNRVDQRYFYGVSTTPPDPTWTADGEAFYIYPDDGAPPPGTVPFHQFYGRFSGSKNGYFYSTDKNEGLTLGLSYQGVAGYIHNQNPSVPAAPSSLRVQKLGAISWRDNSANESGFAVERLGGSPTVWAEVGRVGANVTSYSHPSITCDGYFRVRAFNAFGSAASGSAPLIQSDGRCQLPVYPDTTSAPPSVTLVSPAAGAVLKAGGSVRLAADAFDQNGNGTVAKVEFFADGIKLGEDAVAPYSMTWGGAAAGMYSLTATAMDTTNLATTSDPVSVTLQPVAAGEVLISEFRFRGRVSNLDEFVELYNNTDYPITVSTTDGSDGWSLVASNGVILFTVPKGTIIPPRGNYLGVNSAAYSLGATAKGDAAWRSDIADAAGVALFKTASPSNFTLENRLDAVGFTAVADARFREGAGLQPGAGVTANGEFSFFRKLAGTVTPKDTGDNAADFLLVSNDGANIGGVKSALGAPGPECLYSPTLATGSGLAVTMLDPAAANAQPPNRVRDYASDPANNSNLGTLALRRTVTNNTASPVTRLRFRIADITTYPAPAGTADLRMITSRAILVTRLDGSVVPVQGTTVEAPPAQPAGGGFNTTASVGTVTLTQPLRPGESVYLQFLLGVQQTGSFRFYINVEAWR